MILALGVIAFWLTMGVLIASLQVFSATNELFGLPAFTISVGVFIAVMAIGMAGFFTINLPKQVYMVNPNSQTVAGSFVFGIMTAVLSLPCTAPFMGAALGWHSLHGWVAFAALGIGFFVRIAADAVASWHSRDEGLVEGGGASQRRRRKRQYVALGACIGITFAETVGIIFDPFDNFGYRYDELPPAVVYLLMCSVPAAIIGAALAKAAVDVHDVEGSTDESRWLVFTMAVG